MRIFSFAIGMSECPEGMDSQTPLEDYHKHSPNFLCKDMKGKIGMKII